MGRGPDRYFSQEDLHRWPTGTWKDAQPAVRKIHIKTTMRYHLTTVRMATNKTRNNKYWKGCGEKESLYNAGGNVNWYSSVENSMGFPPK